LVKHRGRSAGTQNVPVEPTSARSPWTATYPIAAFLADCWLAGSASAARHAACPAGSTYPQAAAYRLALIAANRPAMAAPGDP
jgi:hypothetical protein